MKYMKRVSAELEIVGGGPEEEELIVQGVRFAFRVHQVKRLITSTASFYHVQTFHILSSSDVIICCSLPGVSMQKR